jgi:hypothetical protein
MRGRKGDEGSGVIEWCCMFRAEVSGATNDHVD